MRHLLRLVSLVVAQACAVGCTQADVTNDAATADDDLTQEAPAATAAIPTDCRAMLSPAVLEQLGDTPLNHPDSVGDVPAGVQPDGSLSCVWRDPRADTTYLHTTITHMEQAPAAELLKQLGEREGFRCYTPSGGTRCEKTWSNEWYPVTDGRTLFWRDGILIDTNYSNLAPSGYTASIVSFVFGA